MRAILNREAVVRFRIDDEGGVLVNADATPAIAVTRSDGTSVAGVSVVSKEATGVYIATIPAQTALDALSASLIATVATHARTLHEPVTLISERLVPLWRLREDGELAEVPTATLLRIADTIEEWFKRALNFPAVTESYRREWVQEFPTQRLRVPAVYYPQTLQALQYGRGTGSTQYDGDWLANVEAIEGGFEFKDTGTFAPVDFLRGTHRGTFPQGIYLAQVTHSGPWTSPPEDLRRAAASLARYAARTNGLPERARRIETEASIIDLSMPSAQYPTGLPDVDAAINGYRLGSL